jgi:hypothetical protein
LFVVSIIRHRENTSSNQHKDIDSILIEISRCFKEVSDYELFGFVLKNAISTEEWIDPRVYGAICIDYIARDFESNYIGIVFILWKNACRKIVIILTMVT